MPDFLLPLLPEYTIEIPKDPAAWIGWGVWFISLLIALFYARGKIARVNPRRLPWLALFSVMVLFLTPFLGFLPGAAAAGRVGMVPIQHFMVFAAVPWMFAGGIVGILPGVFVAGLSGLLLSYLDTHNIFTPLIFMTFAVSFGFFVKQRYRGKLYRWLRFPLVAAIGSILALLPLVFCGLLLSVDGVIAVRIGKAFKSISPVVISLAGMILIGGVISSVLWIFTRKFWTSDGLLQPSPGEKSLKYQVMIVIAPILMWMLIVIFSAFWSLNERNAHRFKVQQLTATASLIADSLPEFIQLRENALLSLAEEFELHFSSPEMYAEVLASAQKNLPYFDQLILLNQEGDLIANSPETLAVDPGSGDIHVSDLNTRILDDRFSAITCTSDLENQAIVLNFFVKIEDTADFPNKILCGRVTSGYDSNHLPLFNILKEFGQTGGEAQIVGEDGTVLYHTDLSRVGDIYAGKVSATPTYTEGASQSGLDMLTYFLPIQKLEWDLVLSIPVQVVYEITWTQTVPILIFGSSISLIVMAVIFVGLNPLTKTINRMKFAASQVLKGQDYRDFDLEQPLGEVGQFLDVFKALLRLQRKQVGKLNHKEDLGESVADPADLQRTIERLMSLALTRGVSSVRVILSRSSGGEGAISQDQRFGLGEYTQLFAHNDDAIARRTYQEGLFVLNNTPLAQTFQITKGGLVPNLLVASPLTWQNQWLGAVWVTYQDLPSSGHEEIAFIKTLAEKVSRAVVTAQSLEDSKALSNQLEALLTCMPEAVLIADAAGIVLFENPAAQNLFSKDNQPLRGQKLDRLFSVETIEVVNRSKASPVIKEIHLPGDRTYRIFVDQLPLSQGNTGLGIILRDITQDKLKESMKTEFVAMVSHELRSPLTVVHGYAKILRLTGNLNEQQDATMRKIIGGIEEMKHLVQNLLDISRLEDETTMEFEQIDAVHLVKGVIQSLEAQSRQKNIQVALSASGSQINIQADPTYLKQALKNLVDNAIKFSKLGGKVAVNVRVQDQNAVFEVQDKGIGVAPLDQHRLFDKFQRINSPSGIDPEGSGLGLAIVRSVAERHGGKVWLESQLGEGSTFYLQIPISHY